jgi:acyl-CoA thioester hydrolase
MIFDHTVRVRYAETDAMRVAHHAAYLVWFEEGRVECLRSLGFDFGKLEDSGYGQAVREARVQYRRPVRFDQRLRLRVALVHASGPRLVFAYRLFDALEYEADQDMAPPVAVGLTEMIWVTPAGRPTRLPAAHPLAIVLAGVQRHPEWAEW